MCQGFSPAHVSFLVLACFLPPTALIGANIRIYVRVRPFFVLLLLPTRPLGNLPLTVVSPVLFRTSFAFLSQASSADPAPMRVRILSLKRFNINADVCRFVLFFLFLPTMLLGRRRPSWLPLQPVPLSCPARRKPDNNLAFFFLFFCFFNPWFFDVLFSTAGPGNTP